MVVEAVVRIGRGALKTNLLLGIATAAFIAIFFLDVPFPAIVAAAGLLGWLGGRLLPDQLPAAQPHGPANPGAAALPVVDTLATPIRPSALRALRVLGIGLTLWLVPLLALAAAFGTEHVLVQ